MEIITRAEAKAQGLVRYFTGVPCKHGHMCERLVRSATCVECSNAASRNWNLKHGYSSKYYGDHKDEMVAIAKEWRKNNADRVREYGRTPYGRQIATLNQMRRRAYSKGIGYDMTRDDLTIPTMCPILNIPLIRTEGTRSDSSPSYDRIDNTKGYTKDNVRVISWRANRLKSDATIEELESILDYMKNKE